MLRQRRLDIAFRRWGYQSWRLQRGMKPPAAIAATALRRSSRPLPSSPGSMRPRVRLCGRISNTLGDVMRKKIVILAAAAVIALGSTLMAQTFDPNAYNDLVDASSAETIAPGTRITPQNWTRYRRFMGTWMQLAFSGKVHFHVADTPD